MNKFLVVFAAIISSCFSTAEAGPIALVHVTQAKPAAGATVNPNSAGVSQWLAGYQYYGQQNVSVPSIWYDGGICRLFVEDYTYNNGSGNRIGHRYKYRRPDGLVFPAREFGWGFYNPHGQPHASDYFYCEGNPGANMSQYNPNPTNPFGDSETIASGIFSGCRGEAFGMYPQVPDLYMRVVARDDTGGNVVFIFGEEDDIYNWGWGDFNASGGRTAQDIFDFVSCYFSHDMMADINLDGRLTIDDVFSMVDAYFR